MDKDEFYRDIIEGLGIYYDSALIADLAKTLESPAPADLGAALNRNQMRGKKWLVDQLVATLDPAPRRVLILGGWYGVLAALLLNDERLAIEQVTSLDLNPECRPVALSINRGAAAAGRFTAVTGDMLAFDYRGDVAPGTVIVNTSCEHLPDFPAWYQCVPAGSPLVLQSNDYYSVAEHVNCVPDLPAFRCQVMLSETWFSGGLPLKKCTRFMLIGRK
ncbi:MAG: hypothetical protein L0H19_07865 [Salinisphaera sp.]|nr:hypothetical protein [Salinisphaera sp.]